MPKSNIIFIISSLIFFNLRAQNGNASFVELNLGLSRHGTGDLPGYLYGFSYGEEFGNKLFWQVGLEGSTNDQEDFPLTFMDEDGNEFDSTLHEVISGFQLVSGLKYNIVQSTYHQFGISLFAMGRYQATSFDGEIITLFPGFTDLPYPVRLFRRREPSRTISFGGSLRINYQYNIGNNLFLGVLGAVQTDTNGDTLSNISLRFGKIF